MVKLRSKSGMRRFPCDAGELRHSVTLFQIDAEGAVAAQYRQREWIATGIRPAHASQPDLIAQRREDQACAYRHLELQHEWHAFTNLAALLCSFRDLAEAGKQSPLRPRSRCPPA